MKKPRNKTSAKAPPPAKQPNKAKAADARKPDVGSAATGGTPQAAAQPAEQGGLAGAQAPISQDGAMGANRDNPGSVGNVVTPEQQAANAHAAITRPRMFRKRAVSIMAMATDGSPESNRAVIDWARGSATPAFMEKRVLKDDSERAQLMINTKEGGMWVEPGDYVICGIAGEFYPCKPEIFDATYENVVDL